MGSHWVLGVLALSQLYDVLDEPGVLIHSMIISRPKNIHGSANVRSLTLEASPS